MAAREAEVNIHEIGIIATALVANIAYIGLRAIQQRNVVHENRLAIYPTSMFMAIGDYFNPALAAVYAVAARETGDWSMPVAIILAWGIGGGVGSNLAITIHQRYNGKGQH